MAGKIAEKNNHNHLRSKNYDVCTAAALCRCYDPRKYILSPDPKYEMVGKILQYSLCTCIMTSQCKMTSLCRSQCKLMSLCAVSSRELKKRFEMGRFIL
jgi:hypothetical protein